MAKTKNERKRKAKKQLKVIKKAEEPIVDNQLKERESPLEIEIPKTKIEEDNEQRRLANEEISNTINEVVDDTVEDDISNEEPEQESINNSQDDNPSPTDDTKERLRKIVEESDNDDKAVMDLEKLDLSEDAILDEFENSALIDQNTRAITYTIENLYADKKMKKFKNKLNLRSAPPILKIESSTGESAKFYLTRELTNKLYIMLGDVRKAYLGMQKTHQHTDKIPASKKGFGKIVALLRKHSREVILSMIFASAGLFYSKNFVWGSLFAFALGVFYLFFPFDRYKHDK